MNSENKEIKVEESRDFLELNKEKEEIYFKKSPNHLSTLRLNDTKEIDIKLEDNSNEIVNLLLDNNYEKLSINIDINENSNLDFYIGDIADESSILSLNLNVSGENSSVNFHVASLAENDQKKKYLLNVNHLNPNSNSLIDFNGVSKNNAEIRVDAVSFVKENMHKTNANQKVRIILMDKEAKGLAKPILKIDHNDIKASHACAIGNLKEDDLYYLLSRGLNVNDAKKLITLGYLLPITQKFDEESKNKFVEYVGGKI